MPHTKEACTLEKTQINASLQRIKQIKGSSSYAVDKMFRGKKIKIDGQVVTRKPFNKL